MSCFSDQPRRAQNRARTRVALVQALLPRLAEHPLEAIAVSELAKEARISAATFFNHFPSKEHLLVHFIQLWSLRMGLRARAVRAAHASALGALEELFVATAAVTADAPGVMLEIVAAQARFPHDDSLRQPIDLAERLLWLDDADDVMSLPEGGLGDLLPVLIGEAVQRGELPADADVQQLVLAAASIFFGVPLLVGRSQPHAVAPLYRAQLALLWAGARAQE